MNGPGDCTSRRQCSGTVGAEQWCGRDLRLRRGDRFDLRERRAKAVTRQQVARSDMFATSSTEMQNVTTALP
jgi:hypothetical protein